MKRLVFLILILPLAPAGAAYITGKELMNMCYATKLDELKPNVTRYTNCLGYLQGVADTDGALAGWGDKPASFCIPTGVKSEELRQVVIKHLEKRSGEWQFTAASHVVNSFSQAWPCK
jgi:hypothetical protein